MPVAPVDSNALKDERHEANIAGINMDLLKMHLMARKMEQAQKAFITALEDGDGQMAKQHLSEVQKLSDFWLMIYTLKSLNRMSDPQGPRDIFAGGVPVLKMQPQEASQPAIEGQRLGFMSSSRHNPQ